MRRITGTISLARLQHHAGAAFYQQARRSRFLWHRRSDSIGDDRQAAGESLKRSQAAQAWKS